MCQHPFCVAMKYITKVMLIISQKKYEIIFLELSDFELGASYTCIIEQKKEK